MQQDLRLTALDLRNHPHFSHCSGAEHGGLLLAVHLPHDEAISDALHSRLRASRTAGAGRVSGLLECPTWLPTRRRVVDIEPLLARRTGGVGPHQIRRRIDYPIVLIRRYSAPKSWCTRAVGSRLATHSRRL